MLKAIILKEIKQNFRDKRAILLMTLFPLLLIIILGTAFSGVFGEKESFKIDAKVLYKNAAGNHVTEAFMQLVSGLRDMGMSFERTEDEKTALDNITKGEYSCYVFIEDKGIKIYKNDKFNMEANIVESALRAFIDKYNLASEVVKYNPEAVQQVFKAEQVSVIERTTLEKKSAPRAIDYYAVSMVSLIIMYSSMSGMYSVLSEKVRKTSNRLLIAPISKNRLLTGKILGTLITITLQLSMVVLASKVLLKAYWGDDILTISAILITEALMFIAIGVTAAFLFNSESTASGVLNALVPTFAFLGGNYMSLEQFGSDALLRVANISPIRWVNKSILNIIYNNDYSTVPTTIAINFVSIVILLILCSVLYRKEEA